MKTSKKHPNNSKVNDKRVKNKIRGKRNRTVKKIKEHEKTKERKMNMNEEKKEKP